MSLQRFLSCAIVQHHGYRKEIYPEKGILVQPINGEKLLGMMIYRLCFPRQIYFNDSFIAVEKLPSHTGQWSMSALEEFFKQKYIRQVLGVPCHKEFISSTGQIRDPSAFFQGESTVTNDLSIVYEEQGLIYFEDLGREHTEYQLAMHEQQINELCTLADIYIGPSIKHSTKRVRKHIIQEVLDTTF